METLPQQVPGTGNPYAWFCAHCGQPSDLWDWDWAPWPDPSGDPTPPVLCTSCLAELKFPNERGAKRNALENTNRQVRKNAELPVGTIITWRSSEIGDINPRRRERFSGLLFAVAMDDWSLPYLEDVIDLSTPAHLAYHNLRTGGWIDNGALVILGGFVTAGYDSKGQNIPAGWLVCRSLQRPHDSPTCELLLPSGVALTAEWRAKLEIARGAFVHRLDPRRRPLGSGRFETAEDFESAVFAAVAKLAKKRVPTEENIGTYLIARHGRNATKQQRAGESPADPGRQFREWCTRFKKDPKDLIQRALASRVNEAQEV